jgi:hypothetical protein
MPTLDLKKGQRFGALTVLKRAGLRSRFVTWWCRCSCGSVTEIRGSHLVGGTRICRQCRHRRFVEAGARATVPMAGKRFGKLRVVRRAGSLQGLYRDESLAVWTCQCACGNRKDIAGAYLRRRRRGVRSCGHCRRKKGRRPQP